MVNNETSVVVVVVVAAAAAAVVSFFFCLHAKCQARRWFSELHSSCFFCVFFPSVATSILQKPIDCVEERTKHTKTLTREEVGGE